MNKYPTVVLKHTRGNGDVYFTLSYLFDGYYFPQTKRKYESFIEAVLAERKRVELQTAKTKPVFGDPNNA